MTKYQEIFKKKTSCGKDNAIDLSDHLITLLGVQEKYISQFPRI